MTISSPEQFLQYSEGAPSKVIADVETFGKTPGAQTLLGLALAWRQESSLVTTYVVFNTWDELSKQLKPNPRLNELIAVCKAFLRKRSLIGHNIEYDRKWIDAAFGIRSAWEADTRIMWHLTDKVQIERGYGLKTAQKSILKWEESNDKILEMAVRARGGKLSNGDHYLAPAGLLGQYAELDAKATLELYENRLAKILDRDYWFFYRKIQRYQRMVYQASNRGVDVNVEELKKAKEQLKIEVAECEDKINELCKSHIQALEAKWLKEDVGSYTASHALVKFLGDQKNYRKFNPRSNDQKAMLFHTVLGLPISERTETGKPKVDKSSIALLQHPAAHSFVELSEKEKLKQMVESYLDSIKENKIHFQYNVAATVSGRLGGYKPYALNLPFDSEAAMRPFRTTSGYVGIHADLKSVEPCFIAAYSKDPTLLKVHRDGLGDVYLDFALTAFPDNAELHRLYDSNSIVADEVKKKFKKERNVCKIIHLAVGYTGTSVTVSKALTKAGFKTTEEEARILVSKYWEVFHQVKDFSTRCKQLLQSKGYMVNPFGRILNIPRGYEKDAMNRLVQSSAHDALMMWVFEIDKLRRIQLPLMRPILIDCHDSTSWEVPEGCYEQAKEIFEIALRRVSDRLSLGVNLSCEIKPFHTFYGLKNNED